MITNNYDYFIHPRYQSNEQCENSEETWTITTHQDQITSKKTTCSLFIQNLTTLLWMQQTRCDDIYSRIIFVYRRDILHLIDSYIKEVSGFMSGLDQILLQDCQSEQKEKGEKAMNILSYSILSCHIPSYNIDLSLKRSIIHIQIAFHLIYLILSYPKPSFDSEILLENNNLRAIVIVNTISFQNYQKKKVNINVSYYNTTILITNK